MRTEQFGIERLTWASDMDWFRLDLIHGLDPALVEESWRLFWQVSKASVGAEKDSAIFGAYSRESLILYFTPSARGLARNVGAVPCRKPAPFELRLVAGDDCAGAIHFGDALQTRR